MEIERRGEEKRKRWREGIVRSKLCGPGIRESQPFVARKVSEM